MLRTGVDIIEVERIKKVAERHGDRFYKRFFTKAETDYCDGRFESLAVRVAAKEAVSKVLGTGIGDCQWVDIEVVNDKRGKPDLVLHGKAAIIANSLGLTNWSVSLSHSGNQAIAFVVAMGS